MRWLPLLLAALLVACSGGDDDEPSPSPSQPPTLAPTSHSEVTLTPNSSPTATSTPVLLSAVELPTPTWSTPSRDFLEDSSQENQILLDTRTRELIALSEEPARGFTQREPRVLGWASDGRLAIVPYSTGGMYDGILLGPPGGPWQTIELEPFHSAYRAEFSPDNSRMLVYLAGVQGPVVEVDLTSARPVSSQPGFWSGDGYSYDGRFRMNAVADGSVENRFEVIDSKSGTAEVLSGITGLWSPRANVLAYNSFDKSDPPQSVVRIYDAESGTEEVLEGAREVVFWSPDGRYLVVYGDGEPDGFASTEIVDLHQPDHRVRLTNAAPRGWLADGRLLYTTSICGDFDLYAISPDGNSNGPVVTATRYAGLYAFPSPTGERIAYQLFGDNPGIYILDLESNETVHVDAGMYSLPFNIRNGTPWSPDGRYILLMPLPGKDGPCMGASGPYPTTIEVLP